jgi:hypothetical protein
MREWGTVYVQQEADQFIIQYDKWAYYSSSSNYADLADVLAAVAPFGSTTEFDGTVQAVLSSRNRRRQRWLAIVFNAAYLHDSMSILITPNSVVHG